MSVFSAHLAKTGLPDAALAPIEAKLIEAFDLIQLNNERVAQVEAAKAQDPNNTEYLDKLWATHAPTDEKMSEVETQYQLLVDQSEKLLKELREFGKTKIKAPLSEDQLKETKKLVNDSAPTITKAKQSAMDMATIVDQMLGLPHINAAIPGGIISLLPDVESLKQMRGRKAASGSSDIGIYMTRTNDILLDGKSTNREINGEMKGKFNYAADDLSKMWGEAQFEENRVTAEQLEQAFWDALPTDLPLRSKSVELPESLEFEFSKTIKVKNANDDSFTEIPKTVKVTWFRQVVTPKVETPKVEDKPAENAETPKAESKSGNEKPVVEKLSVSDHVKPEPAKKTTPAKPATK